MMDFLRIACAVPRVSLGDPKANAREMAGQMAQAEGQNADLLVFTELSLTGYSCQDLFFQDALYEAALEGLGMLLDASKNASALTAVVGLPLRLGSRMFNCAAVVSGGALRGIVPKTYIPNYNEFYEKRWFSSGAELDRDAVTLEIPGREPVTVGIYPQGLFTIGEGTVFGVEICEDLWTPVPPSSLLALGGAEVLVNLSASNETIGKAAYRRNLVKHQSAALTCVYAYASAGAGESSQDLIFSGQCLIAQNGQLLGESQSPIVTEGLLIRDCDLGAIRADRRKNKSFGDNAALLVPEPLPVVPVSQGKLRSDGTLLKLQKLPFVPEGKEDRMERCMEIFRMQVAGLKRRLEAIGARAVVGISGGLDSTLALLVTVEAMCQLGGPPRRSTALPCPATAPRTGPTGTPWGSWKNWGSAARRSTSARRWISTSGISATTSPFSTEPMKMPRPESGPRSLWTMPAW